MARCTQYNMMWSSLSVTFCSRWSSPGTLISSNNKTDRHDIIEVLMKVTLNTITLTPRNIFDKSVVIRILKDRFKTVGYINYIWTLCQSGKVKWFHVKLAENLRYYLLLMVHTCEPSGGSIFLPILRVPPINFQNLPPVKKIKYQKILISILQSIFLEIPHLELPRWRKTSRDTNGKGECHI